MFEIYGLRIISKKNIQKEIYTHLYTLYSIEMKDIWVWSPYFFYELNLVSKKKLKNVNELYKANPLTHFYFIFSKIPIFYVCMIL